MCHVSGAAKEPSNKANYKSKDTRHQTHLPRHPKHHHTTPTTTPLHTHTYTHTHNQTTGMMGEHLLLLSCISRKASHRQQKGDVRVPCEWRASQTAIQPNQPQKQKHKTPNTPPKSSKTPTHKHEQIYTHKHTHTYARPDNRDSGGEITVWRIPQRSAIDNRREACVPCE